jgi:hypothetical protein
MNAIRFPSREITTSVPTSEPNVDASSVRATSSRTVGADASFGSSRPPPHRPATNAAAAARVTEAIHHPRWADDGAASDITPVSSTTGGATTAAWLLASNTGT